MLSKGYSHFLKKLQKEAISYLLLRYPYIQERAVLDLDILIENEEEYRRAQKTLNETGFILLESEKYRSFWAKKEDDTLLVVDLYKEVSWLGWTLLDKKRMFDRRRKLSATVVVPCFEDDLLVYIAQALFKNFCLNEYKTSVVRKILAQPLDRKYIDEQTCKKGWHKAFRETIVKVKNSSKEKIFFPKSFTIKTIFTTFIQKPLARSTIFFRLLRMVVRKISLKRRATHICLLGPDGSGKSTLAKELKGKIPSFFEKFEVKAYSIYFGWIPFLPTTKLISKLFKTKDYKIVEKMNTRQEKRSLFQELIVFYYFIEYLARYFFLIFPLRRKKAIIITDRYFYDYYAHYSYAPESILFPLLLEMYPKPDFTFSLECSKETLLQRKQEVAPHILEKHLEHYTQLAEKIDSHKINTLQPQKECINEIFNKIWRKTLRRTL